MLHLRCLSSEQDAHGGLGHLHGSEAQVCTTYLSDWGTSFFHLATRPFAISPASWCFLKELTFFPTPVSCNRKRNKVQTFDSDRSFLWASEPVGSFHSTTPGEAEELFRLCVSQAQLLVHHDCLDESVLMNALQKSFSSDVLISWCCRFHWRTFPSQRGSYHQDVHGHGKLSESFQRLQELENKRRYHILKMVLVSYSTHFQWIFNEPKTII